VISAAAFRKERDQWREVAEAFAELLKISDPDLSGIADIYQEAFEKFDKLKEVGK